MLGESASEREVLLTCWPGIVPLGALEAVTNESTALSVEHDLITSCGRLSQGTFTKLIHSCYELKHHCQRIHHQSKHPGEVLKERK